ncbi:putative alcohol dehydrogenase [Actinoplanes missouriensis 431]|uniref:Putative alcohol dehydrogenase n=1 Tax=Actinoplanes missouriensis (strain ATCC 14538 / DSM 43046 / CBS 188.64 / JCM 3121 / NBRC 102363 / NCIMB 12654 / NRRL B-3342 / UNCC 431) TaxID=512565 RepID=I0H606_ACTM4|nr:glucose 1-dehydrogenase [Actinoplanes missouriensis]BAL88443.1 putative alcohol dehydrogenase [Actinoplanes missouriensis 431]
MRALTVDAGVPGSLSLRELPDPDPREGPVLVRTLSVGLCGTDEDIVRAAMGAAPPGSAHLVIGHENLGRVLSSADDALRQGDLVVGFVRRPDPLPCSACAAGEWDMCRNGRYTSRGITRLHGFARDRWRCSAGGLLRLDGRLARSGVLVEPASVVAKAWEQIERISSRAHCDHGRVLITGAGPVGLFAALMATQRGFETHVYDVVPAGTKPELVEALGATYHRTPVADSRLAADILVECTGSPPVIAALLGLGGPATITCLLGMSPGEAVMPVDVAALNHRLVRLNGVVFGTVNANRRHYESAADALLAADPAWLDRLVTRRVPIEEYARAFHREAGDVKVVLEVDEQACQLLS